MKKGKLTKQRFIFMMAAGALVFLLNILGVHVPIEDMKEPNSENRNTEIISSGESETSDLELMKVHFLDVDQGLAIFVELGEEVLVYDGGERDTSSFVVAYLKEQGVTEIDYLISSHYDADHVSGLIGCLYDFDVKTVIGSDYVHDSKLYSSFMTAVEQEGLEVLYPAVGTEFLMGEAVITILSPKEIVSDSNSNSLAIKLSYKESDFIFTGDADYKSEREMVASGIDLDCEVLSVAHHGSASGTSENFVAATTPDYGVISCGKENAYGHPHKETLQVLDAFDVQILRNDESGTIVAETDGTQIWWEMERTEN